MISSGLTVSLQQEMNKIWNIFKEIRSNRELTEKDGEDILDLLIDTKIALSKSQKAGKPS